MENISPDDVGDRMIVNNKLRSPNQMSEPNTMDSFQDGGQQNMNNSDQSEFPPMEGSHINAEMNNFPPGSGEHGMGPDNYVRMNDNMHPGQMQNYPYNRGSYGLGSEQHGGMPAMAGGNEFGTQGSQFHGQYSQSQVRPGYPGMVKAGMSPSRPGMTPPGMPMMSPPGYNPNGQRIMSGQSISQQAGPTPTLNQLLQTPNSTQRYPNNYSEYPGGSGKGNDMGSGNMPYNMQGPWHSRGSYPPGAMGGSSPYRNQSGSIPGEMNQPRRQPSMSPSSYQGGPGQYVGGPHQFSPGSQRYGGMMGVQGRPPGTQMSGPMGNPPFDQMHAHYNQQQQQPGPGSNNANPPIGYSQNMPTSQQQNFLPQQPPPSSQPQPPGPSPPSQPTSQPSPSPSQPPATPIQALQQQTSQMKGMSTPPANNTEQSSQQGTTENNRTSQSKRSESEEESKGESAAGSGEETSDSRGTPTSTGVSHPGVTSLRPVPSPSGSTGSRSNTPASLPGNQAGSPMPPRPPSSQLEGQGRMSQSPMATQGYNQHMMPPPMGPNQMGFGPGGNKMGGAPGQMGPGGQMGGHFSQYNNQYPVPVGTTTVVTQSITCPVTCIAETTTCNSQMGIDSIPSMPTMNCIPMPTFPDEPPEKKKKKSGGAADLGKLYDMGMEPDRRPFLDKLLMFLEDKGTPVATMPSISKQPLDLFKLYLCVKEKGGMVEVNKAKKWKEICGHVNIGSSASAAFTLKKNYIKYLFAYECQFDKGGIDPQPILNQMEQALAQKREQKQKRAPSPAGSQGSSSQDAFRPPSTPNSQGMDPFSPSMPPPYMQNSEGGMGPMGGGMMPPNNMMNPNAMMPPGSNMPHPSSMGGGHGNMPNSMMSGGMMPNNMMPGNMGQNNMMGNNMPPNSMMGGSVPSSGMMGGNMPNSGMMPGNMPNNNMMSGNSFNPQNNMMGNMPPNSMMGNSMMPPTSSAMPHSTGATMPSTSDSISVQDPFADEPTSTSSQYSPRQSVNSQMPPYSNMQQQQQQPSQSQQQPPQSQQPPPSQPSQPQQQATPSQSTPNPQQHLPQQQPPAQPPQPINNSYGYNPRPGVPPNMPPYSTPMTQSGMNSYSEAGSGRMPPQGEQFNDSSSYPRPGMDNFPPNSARPVESFGQNQFGSRTPSTPNRFPFGQQFDRPERFDQQPGPTHPGQQFRPTSQQGMMPPNQGGGPESMYGPRYPGQQMVGMRPPHGGPQEQYPSQSYPSPGPGYSGPRSMMSQDGYPGYSGQQGSFPGPRPSMARDMTGGIYRTPNKHYPDMDRMPPAVYGHSSPYTDRGMSTPSHVAYPHEAIISHHDGHMADPRRGDVGQWSPMTPRYGSQPGGPPNFIPHSMSGMPPVAPSTPPMGPYSRIGPRGSPHPRDKPYMSKSQQKPGPLFPNAQFPPKKEIVFPHDSVEATLPLLNKRRRLSSKDLGPLEAWRLMMALKSGLLAESTWALDTLNVLLFDDSTVAYFNLVHLPGLLEVLVEHFRRCLQEIFGTFEDNNIGYEQKQKLREREAEDSDAENTAEDDLFAKDTFVTWNGKTVKIEEDSPENWVADTKVWDVFSGYGSNRNHWQLGGGDLNDHIVTHLESGKTPEMFSKMFFGRKRTRDKSECVSSNGLVKKLVVENESEETEKEEVCMDTSENVEAEEEQISIKVEKDDHSSLCDKTKLRNNFIKSVHMKTEPRDSGLDSVDSNDSSLHEAAAQDNKVNNLPEKASEKCEENEKIVNHIDKSESSSESDQEAPCLTKEEPFEPSKKSDVVRKSVTEEKVNGKEQNSENDKEENAENDKEENAEKEKEENAEKKEENCEKEKEENGETEMETEETKESKVESETKEAEEVKSEAKEEKESKPETTEPPAEELSVSEQALQSLVHKESGVEEEAYHRDEPPLYLSKDSQDELGRRCVCISNIFRSLSCIPGNDVEMSKHPGLMKVLGKLLLLHHKHLPRSKCHRKLVEKDVESEVTDIDFVDICEGNGEWYWSYLDALRENTLVIFANICGHLNLSSYSEVICFPILDGLLHWAVCPSSCARDPLPSMSPLSVLSPQRLVLEALCKLCIHDYNVDLLLATPPFERIVDLFSNLCKLFSNRKEQVPREFALVLLSELVQGDSSAARAIALQHPCISLLVDFLETAEQNAMQVANTQGISALQNNPEVMGTSLDMLRRAATILLSLARIEENRKLFVHHQSRLLALVMSQILDQTVAQILSDVLFECSLFT